MGMDVTRRRGWVVLGALVAGVAVGCEEAPSTPARDAAATDIVADATSDLGDDVAEAPDVPPTPIEYALPAGFGNAVPRTDPRWNGQYRFLYDAWGTEALGEWPPVDFMLGLLRSEPAVFGNQFERFGFIPDPSDDLPIGFKRGLVNRTELHQTCALCHVGRLDDGRLWMGAPNTRLDIGRFRVEVSRRWVAAGHPPLLSELEQRKALLLGPGRFGADSSDFPQVVPVDLPAYFSLGRRTALNYMGTSRDLRSETYLGIFGFGAGAPNERTARVPFPSADRVAEFDAFFGTMDPPAPPAGDATLVARGRSIFERARCGACHHPEDISRDGVVTVDRTPDAGERLPGESPMFPRGSIRTSYLHRVLQDGDPSMPDGGVDVGRNDFILFIVRQRLSVGMTDGYRVNDIRGLTHTAPYLHNGSVPTLEDLLRPASQRPRTFMRGDFLVDTALPGNGNGGHEFGTDLSADERAALVAYLRSL